jgi:hypothetical protein
MAQTPNTDALLALLEFDPAKPTLTGDVVNDALKEIREEAALKSKDRAKEGLRKAMDIRTKMETCKRNFDKEYRKFDKELGTAIKGLVAAVNGQQPGQVPVDDKDDAGKEAGNGGANGNESSDEIAVQEEQ